MARHIERDEKRDEKRPEKIWNMKAGNRWEGLTGDEPEGHPNRMHIDPAMIPEGVDLQWVTDQVFGQPMPEHRSKFEKRGWTPVHQEDFEGLFNGKFMPRDAKGEITMGGQVLMARPYELSRRAKVKDKFMAADQVASKTDSLLDGNMPSVTMDARHKSARQWNHVNRSFEPLQIPED